MITPETLTDEIAPSATLEHVVLPPMHRNPSAVLTSPCTCAVCAHARDHARAAMRSIHYNASFHVLRCPYGSMPSEAGAGHWRDWHRGHGCHLDPEASRG